MTLCARCGNVICDGFATIQLDPFALEIYDEEVWRLMCEGERWERMDDI